MGGSAGRQPIVFVVSGLPRSGTSMMMRMLAEGGAPILADATRRPDADNPRGYYELEAVKRTARDASWVADAPGRVVKVISSLLPHLPTEWTYRVLFMRRSIDQVVRSQ
ncbi:MAG: sulfotransferase family protein, partial [Kofleriaceae bacterium]